MTSNGNHEPINDRSDETRDLRHAIVSLMEEAEAVARHDPRGDDCCDATLVPQRTRRRDPVFDTELRDKLFTDKKLDH